MKSQAFKHKYFSSIEFYIYVILIWTWNLKVLRVVSNTTMVYILFMYFKLHGDKQLYVLNFKIKYGIEEVFLVMNKRVFENVIGNPIKWLIMMEMLNMVY